VCDVYVLLFFFSSRRRHTRSKRDWSSDVCSSDLGHPVCSHWPVHLVYKRFWHLSHPDQPALVLVPVAAPGCPDGASLQGFGTARSEERRVGKECKRRWRAES